MNKNEIKEIIIEEIKDVLKEMKMDPAEKEVVDTFVNDYEGDIDDEDVDSFVDDPSIEDMSPDPMFGPNPSFVEEKELSEMPRTSNVFKLKGNFSYKDVLGFMLRVNNILKTYKSPGQKRPKARFTQNDMKKLAAAITSSEGFTSKDIRLAIDAYNTPAQANKFLKALEMKGYIELISQLKKAQEPTRDPNAPETRGRKRRDAEFDIADDPTMMDFGDFDDLDLSDPLAENKTTMTNLEKYIKQQIRESKEEILNETPYFGPDDLQFTLQLAQTLGMSVKAMNMAIAAASPVVLTGLIFLTMAAEEGSMIAKKKLTKLIQKLKRSGKGSGEAASAGASVTEPVSENEEEATPEEIEDIYNTLMGKVGNMSIAKATKMTDPIKEAKNPLAKKMKEIENQGRRTALETKLAAIDEMIEETKGRLTRIDEDSEFKEMLDRNAVKEVRKQLKELERAKAKLQKEYAKAQGKGMKSYKKKEVMDEEKPFDEKTLEEMSPDDTKDLALSQAGIPEEVSLNESTLRMQKLAGLITESDIKKKLSLNEGLDSKTSMWARDTMYSVFDGVYDEPEVGTVIPYEFNDVNDEVEYRVGPDFYKVGEQPVVAYEDEDMKVTLRKLNPNDPKAIKFNLTHQLAATIKRVVK